MEPGGGGIGGVLVILASLSKLIASGVYSPGFKLGSAFGCRQEMGPVVVWVPIDDKDGGSRHEGVLGPLVGTQTAMTKINSWLNFNLTLYKNVL